MTATANLGLTLPTVGGDSNQWGGYLNGDLTIIDGVFAAAGTGTSVGLNIGTGKTLVLAGTLNASAATSVTLPAITNLSGPTYSINSMTVSNPSNTTITIVFSSYSSDVIQAGTTITISGTSNTAFNTNFVVVSSSVGQVIVNNTVSQPAGTTVSAGSIYYPYTIVTTTTAQTLTNKTIATPFLTGTTTAGAVITTGFGDTAIGNIGLEIGGSRSFSGTAYADFHTVVGTTDYEARIIRADTVNGDFSFYNTGTGGIAFFTPAAATASLFLTSGGNLGVGTNAPVGRLDVRAGTPYLNVLASDTAGSSVLSLVAGTGGTEVISYARALRFGLSTGANAAGFAERIRFTPEGYILSNTTSSVYAPANLTMVYDGSANWRATVYKMATANPTTQQPVVFVNSTGGASGFINQTANSIAVGTSSDYRLKEDVLPLKSGLSIVSALKPVSFTWKSDKTYGEGFIAHELQEVIPLAAMGEKDAVNEDGTISAQGIDPSKIVVHLVAAVQELAAKVEALTAR